MSHHVIHHEHHHDDSDWVENLALVILVCPVSSVVSRTGKGLLMKPRSHVSPIPIR